MATTTKNWALTSYTNNTWVDVVNENSTLAAIMIANTAGGQVTIQLRIAQSGSKLVTIIPQKVMQSNESFTLDLRSLNLTTNQSLQINASATGVEILASGVAWS